MPGNPIPIESMPGVKRDGTELEGKQYVDAQWCRFRRGRPAKMGGYRAISQSFIGPIYSAYAYTAPEVTRIYLGSSNALQYNDLDTLSGIGGGTGDRIPTAGYIPNDQNSWTMDELFDGGGNSAVLLAHAAPNLATITSNTERKVFFGGIMDGTPLIDTTCPEVSGGVFAAAPYAIAYGNDGVIYWCVPNTPDDWAGAGSGDARPTKSKIVYGARVRGGAGVNPSFLLFSINALIRATFIGGAAVFDFDEVAGNTTIISSRCVVQHNGIFYWIGQGTFNVYNGVVQEIPNDFNKDWFFNNLNRNQLQKIWGMIYPEKGEIRWFAPSGDSEECDMEIIFNYQQNIWYDNRIKRSIGVMPDTMQWPLMVDIDERSQYTYVRPLGGTPSSSAGTAANAFDNDLATHCLAGVNGNIVYDFGDGSSVTMDQVGVNVQTSGTFDLIFEYCNDTGGTLTNWFTLTDPISQAYTASINSMFDCPKTQARAFRVRETNGGTLDAREVFFNSKGTILHQHEFGMDRTVGATTVAIESYFTTSDFSMVEAGQDCWTQMIRLELDFVQSGAMSVEIQRRKYARASIDSVTKNFDPTTEKIDLTEQGRFIRFKFISNTIGGDYELGQTYLFVGPGDTRQ